MGQLGSSEHWDREASPMKFTIRDLMWLTVVVALVIGAWLDRQHLANENVRLQNELEENEALLEQIEKIYFPNGIERHGSRSRFHSQSQ